MTSDAERMKNKCLLCEAEFTQMSDLTKHFYAVHDGKSLQEKIKEMIGVVVNEKKVYKCTGSTNSNDKQNKNKSKSDQITTKQEKFTCTKCDFSTKHKESLQRHNVRDLHNGRGIKLMSKEEVKKVLNFSSKPKSESALDVHKCSNCDFSTRHKRSLNRHIDLLHRKKNLDVQSCLVTKDIKVSKSMKDMENSELKLKINTQSESKSDVIQCSKCDFSTRHERSLKRHIRLLHKEKELRFSSYNILKGMNVPNLRPNMGNSKPKEKVKLKSKHKQEIFECSKCDFSTKHKKSLKRHNMRDVHFGTRGTFLSKSEVLKILNISNPKPPIKSSKQNPITKPKSESNPKEFKCSICGVEFKYDRSLKRHSKNFHEKKNPNLILSNSDALQNSNAGDFLCERNKNYCPNLQPKMESDSCSFFRKSHLYHKKIKMIQILNRN